MEGLQKSFNEEAGGLSLLHADSPAVDSADQLLESCFAPGDPQASHWLRSTAVAPMKPIQTIQSSRISTHKVPIRHVQHAHGLSKGAATLQLLQQQQRQQQAWSSRASTGSVNDAAAAAAEAIARSSPMLRGWRYQSSSYSSSSSSSRTMCPEGRSSRGSSFSRFDSSATSSSLPNGVGISSRSSHGSSSSSSESRGSSGASINACSRASTSSSAAVTSACSISAAEGEAARSFFSQRVAAARDCGPWQQQQKPREKHVASSALPGGAPMVNTAAIPVGSGDAIPSPAADAAAREATDTDTAAVAASKSHVVLSRHLSPAVPLHVKQLAATSAPDPPPPQSAPTTATAAQQKLSQSSRENLDVLLWRVSSTDVEASPLSSLTASALSGVASLAQEVSSKAPRLLHSGRKAAAAAARTAVAVASAAAAAAAEVVAADISCDQAREPLGHSSSSRHCSTYDDPSSSSGRIRCVAHDWADPAPETLISCVCSLQPPSPVSDAVPCSVAAVAAETAAAAATAAPPLAFSAVASHGAERPVFTSSQQMRGYLGTEGQRDEEEEEALGLQLPPSPRTLRSQEEAAKQQGTSRSASVDSERRIRFAPAVAAAPAEDSLMQQQQQRSIAQMLPVISSPSYAFMDAQSLGDLLSLPSPNQSTLRVRVWRFRGMLPPRWLEEDLLLHQNLLLFCRNTEPLEVSLLVPLASVAAGWAVDGKGRVSTAAAGKGKLSYRMKLMAAAGAAAQAVSNEKRTLKGSKTILLALDNEAQRDTLLKHILYLADKWRSRPAVPDFLYRPACQQQMVLLRKQLHEAARNLLLSQLSALVRGCLARWAREFFGRLRGAVAAAAAAKEREAACTSRGVLLLQQWLLLRGRRDGLWGLQRLRLHALEQQHQQQTAAVVSTLATGHLELASHRVKMARQQLDYVVSRLLRQQLHAAFMRLMINSAAVTMQLQTQRCRVQQLVLALWQLQRRQLQAGFMRLRRASVQQQLQQKALEQLFQRLRQSRLKWAWQQLLLHLSSSKLQSKAGSRKAVLLACLCVNARLRSCLRQLQRHAAAAEVADRLRVCSNLQKVNERLLASMQQIPRQRGMMLLGRLLEQLMQQRLSWAFCCWRTNMHHQKQRVRAALLLMLLLQVKQQQLMRGSLTSLQSHVHFQREVQRQKMHAAWLLGLLLREQELRGLRLGWLCLQRHRPQTHFQRALQLIASVAERAEFRQMRRGFLKLQQLQAAGQAMRYFLRAQLLLQLVTRLQVQLVKQQALGFSALRSHAAIVGARNAAAKATIPENETLRSTGVFEADSTYCVSATTAAAASERLQQLLDMSSDMLDRQHQSLSELASCQKPLLYLPQPFAAEHAARAAAAVTQNSYPVRAPPSLLSQETSDGEDGCFLPSASPQPTLLQLGPCGPRSQGFTQHAADKAFDHGIPFGVSVTTPSADPPTGIADYRPQTRLVQPVVNLSQGRGSASSSSNFFASSHVLDDADCSAHEAELDAILSGLQRSSNSSTPQTPLPEPQSQQRQQPQQGTRRPASGATVHTVRGRQPPMQTGFGASYEIPAAVQGSHVPYYCSCPTAVEASVSPRAIDCWGCRTTALSPLY